MTRPLDDVADEYGVETGAPATRLREARKQLTIVADQLDIDDAEALTEVWDAIRAINAATEALGDGDER